MLGRPTQNLVVPLFFLNYYRVSRRLVTVRARMSTSRFFACSRVILPALRSGKRTGVRFVSPFPVRFPTPSHLTPLSPLPYPVAPQLEIVQQERLRQSAQHKSPLSPLPNPRTTAQRIGFPPPPPPPHQ